MILVTGAAGFVGQHLTSYLKQEGFQVAGLDIASMDAMNLDARYGTDITDDKAMASLGETLLGKIQACVHLAAIASPPIAQKNPELAWSTNVRGTHNVLQLLHRAKCPRIVFFSSAHVYGISPKYMPTDERHPLALHDTYTTTKIAGEQLCQLFYENHGVSYCNLRLWNAYGPGQSADYFIGAKIRQARSGKLTIRNEGVTKDWVHISDVVRAARLAVTSDYVGPLNVGTGVETSLDQIIKKLATRFGVQVEREAVTAEGPSRMLCDNNRIVRTLGWEPKVTFEQGLTNLVDDAVLSNIVDKK